MNNSEIKSALQDLIIRLQDAEKGFKEVAKATSNDTLRDWLLRYSDERHNFHRELEAYSASFGGDPEVKTSFLGDLHRMFIDIKINNVSMENEFDAVVTEIERGSSTLLSDYDKVLAQLKLTSDLSTTLMKQRGTIQKELSELLKLKEEFNSVEA